MNGLYYITGASAAGKSTIRKELIRRGYVAYDTDEDNIACWHLKNTGEITDNPHNTSERTTEWYSKHDWKMSRSRVQELYERATNQPIFLCGVTSNQSEMMDLFSRVFCLTIDEETLKHRLASRTNNGYGKTHDELVHILDWHATLEQECREQNAILVDSTKPIESTTDKILNHIEALSKKV